MAAPTDPRPSRRRRSWPRGAVPAVLVLALAVVAAWLTGGPLGTGGLLGTGGTGAAVWAGDGATRFATPLERSGQYTSLDEEAEFWAALAEQSPRVSVEVAGESVLHHPIWLVAIGATGPPVPRESDGALLVTGLLHGDERAGREAALTFARDLALSTAPEVVDYLRDHPVFLLPTVNPDALEQWDHTNADGVDLNRDLAGLTEPESRTVMSVITAVHPQLTVDLHEADVLEVDVMVDSMSPAAAHPGLNALGDRLEQAVVDRLGDAGLAAGLWPFPVTDGVTVQDVAALSHSMNLLVETDNVDRELADRHRLQLAALTAAAEFQRTEGGVVARTVADSRSWARSTAAAGEPYVFRDGARSTGATAYVLTGAQHSVVAGRLAVMGVDARRDGAHWVVERDQDAALLIPPFLDPGSPDHGVAARPRP